MALSTIRSAGAYSMIETPAGPIFAVARAPVDHSLIVSTNDGATWSTVPGMTGISIHPQAITLNGLGEILAGSLAASPHVYYCTSSGSTDTGALANASTGCTRFTDDVSGVVYAANDDGSWIHKSTDHGHTWSAIAVTFPGGAIGQMYAIEQNATLGLMTGGEIGSANVSTNSGSTWTGWGLTHPSSRAPTDYHGNLWNIKTSPISGTVFATIGDPDVPGLGTIQRHLTTDLAGIWHGVTGMRGSGGEDVSTFIFWPNGTIWAGCIYQTPVLGEVYESTNDGASWTEISSTLGVTFSKQCNVHLGPSGRAYVSDNNGIYRQGGVAGASNSLFFGGGV